MEQLALFNCFITLLLGALLLFMSTRMGKLKKDLNRRIAELEAQVDTPVEAMPNRLSVALDSSVQEANSAAEAQPLTAPQVAASIEPQQSALPPQDAGALEANNIPTAMPTVNEAVSPVASPAVATTPSALSLPPLLSWFLRIHLMVQVGIVILFIGIAFLLKYVADQGWLSLELRHLIVAGGGALLAGVGWRMRTRARTYGLALQGAGIGVVYMTVFFAFRIYELLPAGIAFSALAILGALCAGLAVLNNARILAFLAVIGAFLAPILASTGEGSHVALFSYYALVNLAILVIAWFKAWRSLNLAGFFFTLAAGSAWGASAYEPALFGSTEPFLLLFFGFYLAISILYAIRQPPLEGEGRGAHLVDITLVFGNPFSAFALQAAITAHLENGAGWSALLLGVLYCVIALLFMRQRVERFALLSEAFLFLGFFFLAFSVPYFLESQATAAAWAVSGGAWVWLGAQRRRIWTVLWGGLVQFGAMMALGWAVVDGLETAPPWLNALYLGVLLISGAAFASAYFANRLTQNVAGGVRTLLWLLSLAFLTVALGWWLGGNSWQIVDASMAQPGEWALTVHKGWLTNLIFFYAATALAGELIGRWLNWQALRLPMVGLLPLLMALAVGQLTLVEHHFAQGGWMAWPAALAVCYLLLYRWRPQEHENGPRAWLPLGHAWTLWLASFVLIWFAAWYVSSALPERTWTVAAIGALCALIGVLVMQVVQRGPHWIRQQRTGYLWLGLTPILLFALAWLLLMNVDVDGSALHPYLPLLNPLDLSYLLLFGVSFVWIRRLQLHSKTLLYWLWGVLGFCALNLLIARGVHHVTGVDFTFSALYGSPILQTSYAILWGVLALTLMFWGARRTRTALWSGGAAILALTVLKLFLVDLAHSGAIERIVSFIGVGLLITVIAYFAPAPVKQAQIDEAYSQ